MDHLLLAVVIGVAGTLLVARFEVHRTRGVRRPRHRPVTIVRPIPPCAGLSPTMSRPAPVAAGDDDAEAGPRPADRGDELVSA